MTRPALTGIPAALLAAHRRLGTVGSVVAVVSLSVVASLTVVLGLRASSGLPLLSPGMDVLLAVGIPALVAPPLSAAQMHLVATLDDAWAEVARLSAVDTLTGAATRATFFDDARRIVEGGPEGAEVVVAMVDVDHFKAVNDTHGHAVGDAALAALASRLLDAVGERGTVGRLGGDEFACVVPAPGGADAVVTRLTRATHGLGVADPAVPARPARISASLGAVTVHARGGLDLDAVLARADAELYRVKASRRAGRGVIPAPAPEPAPAPAPAPARPAAAAPRPAAP